MEVELRINITPTDVPPINRHPNDPVFLSTEFETFFILFAHLKEYQREKLKIDRNEDGTQLAVSGERVVSGLLAFRIKSFRTTPQVMKFRKVFWIPDGVAFDQIKARFNEKESVLWIFMPKSVSGVGVGVGVEEVKEEEIGRGRHRRTRPVPDKVPEREIHRKNEEEMKEGKKDVPQHEPDQVKEVIPKTQVAEIENSRKNEQEMKEEKKDVKATDEDMGRLPHHEPEQVEKAIPKKEATERDNPRKNEQEMEEGKKDVKATDEVVGILPHHEPEEVKKEAADITMTRPDEEPSCSNKREVPSNEETPAKEDSDLEAKGRAAEEKSEEFQHSPEVIESTKVKVDRVTQGAQVEKYNAPEENGEVEIHLPQQESNIEIQEAAQLKFKGEPDPTEPLKPDHPEEVQGMGNKIQSEIGPVIPPEENVDCRKGLLCSPRFFAGSAILVSSVVLVIHFSQRKRR